MSITKNTTMNTTTTHRRFAVRRLLPSLALLVASVSCCAPLNAYSGPPFTPAAVRYNLIATHGDRVDLSLRITKANMECIYIRREGGYAEALGSAEQLAAAGAKMLPACQEGLECVRDGLLSMAVGKITQKNDPSLYNKIVELEKELICVHLIKAEQWGADRRAVGQIYYDYARIILTGISILRTKGIKDTHPQLVKFHNVVVKNMQQAQARGIAEADAYLRTH